MSVEFSDPDQALELRGVLTALNVLRVMSPDLEAIARDLDSRIHEAPELFQGAPVLLDVSALENVRLNRLVDLLRTRGLVPVAVSGLPTGRVQEASAVGLGILDAGGAKRISRRAPESRADKSKAAAEPQNGANQAQAPVAPLAPSDLSGSMTLTQPLRSGQIIYADGRDAIALAAVNPGAELIADGNIHIYAALRGRAMAGARGNTEARIYCQKLEADLVAIAGVYLSADELPKQHRGKAVQIWLEDGELSFSELISR